MCSRIWHKGTSKPRGMDVIVHRGVDVLVRCDKLGDAREESDMLLNPALYNNATGKKIENVPDFRDCRMPHHYLVTLKLTQDVRG